MQSGLHRWAVVLCALGSGCAREPSTAESEGEPRPERVEDAPRTPEPGSTHEDRGTPAVTPAATAATPAHPDSTEARERPMKFDHERGGFVPDASVQGYYEVKTWWRTLEDFTAWTRSPAFAEAHRNKAPKEMFAGPSVLEIHELLTSTDLETEG